MIKVFFLGFEIFNFGIFFGSLINFKEGVLRVFKTIRRFVIVPMYPGHVVP